LVIKKKRSVWEGEIPHRKKKMAHRPQKKNPPNGPLSSSWNKTTFFVGPARRGERDESGNFGEKGVWSHSSPKARKKEEHEYLFIRGKRKDEVL